MAQADTLDHAHRVFEVVRRGARDLISDVVASSWARCLNEYGLDPARFRRPPALTRSELAARQSRMAAVIECARFEMTTLFQQLGDAEMAVVLTDTDGVVLHLVSSAEFQRVVQPLGLEVGAVWSEAQAGTNGMGTCVAAAGPIAVRLDDHFYPQYHSLTCSAVPIYDPSGEMTAVLDVSSRSNMPQEHLLVLLGMTARMIENRLIDLRFRDANPIHFHSRREFVYTLHEGKLVVDDDGRVLAANRSALLQLGLKSVHEVRACRLDQIFHTTLDDMLERSHRAAFNPVVTYRANAAQRFFAVARQPVRDEGGGFAHEAPGPARGATPVRGPLPALPAAAVAAAGGLAAAAPLRLHGTAGPARLAGPPAHVPAASCTFADPRLHAHLGTARRVIARGTPLLLRGETGVGKEVFARAVHADSPHAGGPFVAVNCASLPETLIEAELFGYRPGAFTGADKRGRRGKVAQADGGTLFLDEIGDMPLALQARLLRVLDERMVTPLGGDATQPVDFQLMSASHCNLLDMVEQGRFREDLYYRLAGIELVLPALRERQDRAELIRNVLAEEGRPDAALTPAAWDLLMRHPWPGNVRQLHHVLRTAAALSDGGVMKPEHLPSLADAASEPRAIALEDGAAALDPQQAQERQGLLDVLEGARWNVSQVAKALGVSRNTLYRRMHRLHIPVTQGSDAR